MPNCIVLGSRVETTWLKEALLVVNELQQTGLVWLKRLKASARNWPPKRSVNLMFLKTPASVRQNPGKRTAPGCSDGIVVWPATALVNAAALNQPVSKLCGAPLFGS